LVQEIRGVTALRPLLRQAAYRSGALSLARMPVRRALTVVMLHRVMDPGDPDFPAADPTYTISAPLFEQLLEFFREHYSVVGLEQVFDAVDGKHKLPDHALLITFDDGWADNLHCAAPLLHARRMPAVVFVALAAVQESGKAWWQEEVFALGRSGRLGDWLRQDKCRARIIGTAANGTPLDVVTHLALMEPDTRQDLLASLPRSACHTRMMLDASEVRRLADFGIAVGLHGYRHVPLTSVPDIVDELSRARAALAELTAGSGAIAALACPHGRYNASVVEAAGQLDIRLVFTSDKLLNATTDGMLTPGRPLGRVSVIAAPIEAAPHHLDASAAARWLWPRECR
jgi:peptidoglycan/xylan/chitin deacetylase (PgdA/CDA1 family)